MAELNIRYGKQASLNALTQKTPGTIYITNDTHQMYVDLPNNSNNDERIHISGLIRCETVADLQALTPYSEHSLYYVAEKGALLIYTGSNNDKADASGINNGASQTGGVWKQLNKQVVTAEELASIESDIEELKALFDRVDKAEKKVETLEGKMSTAEEDIAKLKLDVEGIVGGEDSSSLSVISEKVNTLDETVGSLSSTVEELNSAFKTQGEAIDTLNRKVSDLESLSGTVQTQGQDIIDIKAVNETQRTDIAGLKEDVLAINGTIEEIQGVVSGIPDIKEKDIQQDKKIESLEDRADDLETASQEHGRQIEALQGKAESLEGTVGGHTETINQHAEAINGLTNRVTAVESLNGRMDSAEEGIDGLIEDLAIVDGKVTTNINNIIDLQTRMSSAESSLNEHAEAIDNINDNIDAVELDLANKYNDILNRMDVVNSMAFKGAVGENDKKLPADEENSNDENSLINAGDTYLVSVSDGKVYRYKVNGSYVNAYAGDLIVALSDQSEAGYYDDWQLISSGYVRDFNPELSAANNSIALTSIIASADQDTGDLGKITFVEPDVNAGGVKVEFTPKVGTNEVDGKISIIWGTF